MANPNPNSKKKATPKAKAKAKPRAKPQPKTEVVVEETSLVLTRAEEFYIENNPGKTDSELSLELGAPIAAVRQHIHRTEGNSRINKLLIREKGCTVMTAGASEAADNSRKGYVTQQKIEDAVRRQDYDEAARLKAMLQLQLRQDDEEAIKRQHGHIYYMHSPRKKPTEVRR